MVGDPVAGEDHGVAGDVELVSGRDVDHRDRLDAFAAIDRGHSGVGVDGEPPAGLSRQPERAERGRARQVGDHRGDVTAHVLEGEHR